MSIWKIEASEERLDKVIRATPVAFMLCVYMPIFSTLKSAIPLFNEFQWDTTFIAWDRALLGADAWKIFYPFMFNPIVLAITAFLYHFWIFLIYAGGMFFAFHLENPKLRERYFISYFLIWTVIGGFMAIYFSSVGPCFAQRLMNIPDFEPLMTILQNANRQIPIMVLEVQDQLVFWQLNGERGLGRGITAMPSMHVSLALLFFLAIKGVSNQAKRVFGAFFVVICIGSVVTGYHYAVDGIIAAIVTGVIWYSVGFVQKLTNPRNPMTGPHRVVRVVC